LANAFKYESTGKFFGLLEPIKELFTLLLSLIAQKHWIEIGGI
jgi:hypothetical protein